MPLYDAYHVESFLVLKKTYRTKGKFQMANLQYKKTLTTSLKVVGTINTSDMTVEVNGEIKKLSVLLSDLNGEEIEINVKTKEEMELDLPEDNSDDED